ncbi:MAG: hypothetical protein IJY70_00540 [Clostridia bacterium]|nr:hypothetical protein [Clostridia bacterium]
MEEKTVTPEKKTDEQIKKEKAKKEKERRAIEEYKRRYFAFYDDIKISHREDW